MNPIWRTIRYLGQFVVLGLAIAFVVTLPSRTADGGNTQPNPAPTLDPTQLSPSASPRSYADAVAMASPAVVNIYADRVVQQVTRTNPQVSRFTGQSRFRRQFLNRSELGAGVIASSEGYVITNLHIVNAAEHIYVGLYDGRFGPAELVGGDPATDLAVLKIDAGDLPLAAIGDSESMRVGDVVLAIGNPFGLGKTVTMGIVSATGRGDLEVSDYADLIQTDAAINRGNSGGALIDANGKLIGINTAMLDQQDAEGIGFAIPIETALDVMEQLIDTGVVTRGWLGVQWLDGRIYPQLRAQSQGQPGHVIGNTMSGGPADRAGLQRGDYVVSINGGPVGRLRNLLQTEAEAEPGSVVTLEYWRDGELNQTEAALIQRPPRLGSSS